MSKMNAGRRLPKSRRIASKHKQTGHIQQVHMFAVIAQTGHRQRACPDRYVASMALLRQVDQVASLVNQK
jgi:hypothetical protein